MTRRILLVIPARGDVVIIELLVRDRRAPTSRVLDLAPSEVRAVS